MIIIHVNRRITDNNKKSDHVEYSGSVMWKYFASSLGKIIGTAVLKKEQKRSGQTTQCRWRSMGPLQN